MYAGCMSSTYSPEVAKLLEQATITVTEAARVLKISRGLAYQEARLYERTKGAEGLPVIRVGRRMVVPTHALRRMLGGKV